MMVRLRKIVLITCGSLAVALGVIGIFVPLMPTTVFLLAAAACYARSSDRFYRWLIENRWLGGYIRAYREGHGMARSQKVLTLVLLWVSIGASVIWAADVWWLRVLLVLIASGVTVHIARIKAASQASLPQPDVAA